MQLSGNSWDEVALQAELAAASAQVRRLDDDMAKLLDERAQLQQRIERLRTNLASRARCVVVKWSWWRARACVHVTASS